MKAFVGFVATVATVMHFTFGCCAHPWHFTGHAEKAEAVQAGSCCRHSHSKYTHSDGRKTKTSEHADGWNQAHHSCEGCVCAATQTAEIQPVTSGDWVFVESLPAMDGNASALQLIGRANALGDPPRWAKLRLHSLFERFLI